MTNEIQKFQIIQSRILLFEYLIKKIEKQKNTRYFGLSFISNFMRVLGS